VVALCLCCRHQGVLCHATMCMHDMQAAAVNVALETGGHHHDCTNLSAEAPVMHTQDSTSTNILLQSSPMYILKCFSTDYLEAVLTTCLYRQRCTAQVQQRVERPDPMNRPSDPNHHLPSALCCLLISRLKLGGRQVHSWGFLTTVQLHSAAGSGSVDTPQPAIDTAACQTNFVACGSTNRISRSHCWVLCCMRIPIQATALPACTTHSPAVC
jgi:hypothetical protein